MYRCPSCGKKVKGSLVDNVTNPLDITMRCEKCGHIFTESEGTKKYEVRNDQTAKADKGKPKLTLVPRQIIYDIAEVREYGNAKYPEGGPDNWKKVDKQRYRDALFRHLLLYLDDPNGVDEESGIKHLKHIACNVAFLCEFENYAEEYIRFYDTTGSPDPYFTMKVGDVLDGAWKREKDD